MKTFDTVEDEVDEIRLRIYEENKNHPREIYSIKAEATSEALAKEFGFERTSRAKKANPPQKGL